MLFPLTYKSLGTTIRTSELNNIGAGSTTHINLNCILYITDVRQVSHYGKILEFHELALQGLEASFFITP